MMTREIVRVRARLLRSARNDDDFPLLFKEGTKGWLPFVAVGACPGDVREWASG